MKIIYCLPQLYRPGGIERVVSIKANYLADVCGYEVIIVAADQCGNKPFYPLNDKIKIIDLNLPYDKTLGLPFLRRLYERHSLQKKHKRKLTELLMKERPDITISTFTHEAEFLPQIKDSSKKILEFHFCKGHKKIMAEAFGFGLLTKLLYNYKCWKEENIIIPAYDKFVVLTEEDRRRWSKKIPNVIHISNSLPFENEGKAMLDNKHVIAVGRLDAQKGFNRLIDIWAKVVEKLPDWHLDIYGQGRDEERLQQQIEILGINPHVTIHTPDSNIKQRYLESSIFCMTSSYEGLPMTLLEATGLGIPAICYSFPCGPKDVIVDGVNGYLIDNSNEKMFAERLICLMSNDVERKKMGDMAYNMAYRYSRCKIMNQWLSLFENINNNNTEHER